MERVYENVVNKHLAENRQMVFLVGPRQVGKTTTSLDVSSQRSSQVYLNWDAEEDRKRIVQGPEEVAQYIGIDQMREGRILVVFDELHKYKRWKSFLKGFFDKYSKKVQILVTGSARLDIYKAGGDSLMGRYFPYRLHPLSVAEILSPKLRDLELATTTKQIAEEEFQVLFTFGGFPEPFLRRDQQFFNRWKRLRSQQLFSEDLRDLTRIQDLAQMELFAKLLAERSGALVSYTSLANQVGISVDTVRRWLKTLKAFYYCFTLQPWSKNVTRSLLKEPKVFLWDWAFVEDEGARIENFIASHLLKAVHFWTDMGFGEYGLYFLRDKEKREVDFLVAKNNKPWFLVEVKKSLSGGISKSLYHFQSLIKAEHAFQVVFDKEYVAGNCFESQEPMIVSARSFLSQLV